VAQHGTRPLVDGSLRARGDPLVGVPIFAHDFRLIVLIEGHVLRVLREFAAYYNLDRPHRSLALAPPIRPTSWHPATRGAIVSRPVLGGLHHVYSRAA
jgi:hypothetical protein